MRGEISWNLIIFLILIVIGIFGMITFSLSAATLGTVNKRLNRVDKKLDGKTIEIRANSKLGESIEIDDLISHLKELETIAKNAANTRAISTRGFEETVIYIENYLKKNTNFRVWNETFRVQNFSIKGTPKFSWRNENQNWTNLIYSTNLVESDFAPANYTAEILNSNGPLQIFLVNDSGCLKSNWIGANGKAALVRAGGVCTFAEKGELATEAQVAALIYYNNGETTSNLAPVIIRLRQRNKLPSVVLSYKVGTEIRQAALKGNVYVQMEILRESNETFAVKNVFAETLEGDANKIISVGSHSDSVPEGPGINDNGSGTSCNLVLARNLARLYQEGKEVFPYRVRFSWWGAEEFGLIGSIDHVLTSVENNEWRKYLVNLNFDMLGSPNFMFGVYDANLRNPTTPEKAIKGSLKITEAFQDWFRKHDLPFTNTEFSGRSDYGPFLQQGIVSGGLFSGADGTKTMEEFREYRTKLGQTGKGIMNAIHDPCYHRSCDNNDNVDPFALKTMVQAAADVLDFLGRQKDLENFLYPDGRD